MVGTSKSGLDPHRIALAILAGLAMAILVQSVMSVLLYPVPDTGMWFGDESWTMLTLRAMARTGVAHVPEALGSSLAINNGLVNGCVWLSALLYGTAANLFQNALGPVAVGRIVSVVLSFATMWLIYRSAVKLGEGILPTLACIVAFLASPAFAFSSHSARLDMATGLAVVGYYYYCLQLLRRHRISNAGIALLGFGLVASLTIYVHIPTLLALPALYTLWCIRGTNTARALLLFFIGALVAAVLILITYYLTTGAPRLLGEGYNQYHNVANSLPILHPFSWQVQKINTIDRAIQLWRIAWPMILLAVLAVIGVVGRARQLRKEERFTSLFIILVALSWMAFEGPAVYYNIHVLPIFAVGLSTLLDRAYSARSLYLTYGTTVGLLLIVGTYVLTAQGHQNDVGAQLVRENRRAITTLLAPVSRQNPLILTDEPGYSVLSAMPGVRLMTNHLLLFGNESSDIATVLRHHDVNYLLLYSTWRWQSPFRTVADSLYDLIGIRTGHLTDQARDYQHPEWERLDTLRLYKARL